MTRRSTVPLIAAILLLATAAGCRTTPPRAAKQAAATSSSASGLIFSHAQHLEQDIACTTCHAGIDTSTTLAQPHLPPKKVCADCHDVEQKDGCKTCHRNPAAAGKAGRRAPTPHIVFSHKVHLARKVECVTCHTGAMVAASVESIVRPKMRDCLSCHNHKQQYRSVVCSNCHESLRDFPLRAVSQYTHDGDFVRQHGRMAAAQADLCAACHRESYCVDCHSRRMPVLPSVKWPEQVQRDFVHRGDYLSRHAIEAQADPQMCTRCHSPKTCDSCHSERGVSATMGRATSAGSPHPADWMRPGSPNGHGTEARRNIVACASCHDQGPRSNCVHCHSSTARGGQGINPHPPGWDREGKTSEPMCRFCH